MYHNSACCDMNPGPQGPVRWLGNVSSYQDRRMPVSSALGTASTKPGISQSSEYIEISRRAQSHVVLL